VIKTTLSLKSYPKLRRKSDRATHAPAATAANPRMFVVFFEFMAITQKATGAPRGIRAGIAVAACLQ
jgi:hypothetical protein